MRGSKEFEPSDINRLVLNVQVIIVVLWVITMDIPASVLDKLKMHASQKHPKSICIANYKGGVGKTTITCLLGYFLADHGHKVLLIDIDPQCSLSLAVGFDLGKVNKTDFTIHNLVTPTKWSKIAKTKFSLYIDSVPDIFAPKSLKIIKGSFEVDELDLMIAQAIAKDNRALNELFLYCRQMINAFDDFDYILVDCPPNKMFLTQAMIRACSYYITVTIPDRISIYGMPRLLRWVKLIEKEEKPRLLGCIVNAVNRSGGSSEGTANQQQASQELIKSIQGDLDNQERMVIGEKPVLVSIPRLDVISRFLSQEDIKMARFDLQKSSSAQAPVSTIMVRLTKLLKERIEKYAKL